MPLKHKIRADLFGQLATLEEAGLPFDKMLDVVHLPRNEAARLKTTRKWVRLGVGIAEAGRRSGLFTPLEASLVRAASFSGSPARTYRLMADQCARRAARMKTMTSRLSVPAVTLAAWIFLGPVPDLFSGGLTLSGYLGRRLLPWIAAGGGAYLLLHRLRYRQSRGRSAWQMRRDGVFARAPLFGPMEVRRNLRDFFESLAILLEGGIAILEALPIALDTVRNQALRSQLAQIKPRIEAGMSFAQAIAGISLFGSRQRYGLIQAGEASGALPRMLLRYCAAETAAIDLFDDLVAEWIPRLAYTSTALLVGYGLIHSGAFMPSLPQELR